MRSPLALITSTLIAMLIVSCHSARRDHSTITVRWQRLVDDTGSTCTRCGITEDSVLDAHRQLAKALRPLGLSVRLETRTLDFATFQASPGESNRIWIDDVPLEQWLGATIGESACCGPCGDANCRTMQLTARVNDGVVQTYEAIPADLIIKAGLLAAAERVIACR